MTLSLLPDARAASRRRFARCLGPLAVLVVLLLVPAVAAQDNETCLECHGEEDIESTREGREISLYIDAKKYGESVHAARQCIDCHQDAAVEEFPHPTRLKRVNCAECHEDAQEVFLAGIHGKVLVGKDERLRMLAPTCAECHGSHHILRSTDPKSRTYKMNIPALCGSCHAEGQKVARMADIPQHEILQNYSQDIHGKGLFKKGLIVTATCTDCHGHHKILPHTDPESSVSLQRVAKTCMKCHARIEDVHVKVIRGELWEEKPGAIPACSDCHPPHRVARQNIVVTVQDRRCLECHERPDIHKIADGQPVSLVVGKEELSHSAHRKILCVKCHSSVTAGRVRPCETATRVDCSACHEQIASEYFQSGHGQGYLKKDPKVPYCTDCHGDHGTKSVRDETSPTYRAHIPKLCGDCHQRDGKAATVPGLKEINVLFDYSKSVHGRSLVEKGLVGKVAVCTDCHHGHLNLRESDPRSSVYPKNIPATCGSCHKGILDQYVQSVHAIHRSGEVQADLPTCASCHSAHGITETAQDEFMTEVTQTCGRCHRDLAATYLDTMHGKAYQLGYLRSAKCSDCHGAHKVLAVNDPESAVAARQIVETCQKCHADANRRFTGYLTHATHHDKTKYPILYYTFWFMTFLLVGTFAFFGVHTLLWLPRSIQGLREKRKHQAETPKRQQLYIRRFTSGEQITHAFVIISFVGLALTGMTLKFANMGWAQLLAKLLGGVTVAGTIHRTCAVITFGYFAFHLASLVRVKRRRKTSWWKLVFGHDSMMFNLQDVKDFFATLRWFLGLGPRPAYGLWTYWEKFDYFAVFWGVTIIGFSGLMLWFPEYFTHVLPGWVINVAQIIHSDEALLAVGFIFTIHFFNTHLRPEVFPMDMVIFTGLTPLEEYRQVRPRGYERMKRTGRLRRRVTRQGPSARRLRAARIFGSVFLAAGVSLILLILYSMLFGYL